MTRRKQRHPQLQHHVLVNAIIDWCKKHPSSGFNSKCHWLAECVKALRPLYSLKTCERDRCYGIVKIAFDYQLVNNPIKYYAIREYIDWRVKFDDKVRMLARR